ncbi:MAG: alpha/beta hydrolase family protein [Bryobacteraceae bacterium]
MKITPFQQGLVRGFLHQPSEAATGGLVITHGAGSNCEAPLLVAFARVFCEAGWLVLRCDLAFRQKRPAGPPIPAWAADDRAGLMEAATAVRQMTSGPVILGGHSYGGRQASLLAADEQEAADALLLLSYPLHPPTRPDQLRTTHWPSLRTPSFFVHGTKDPFGSVEEMRSALPLIAAPTSLVTIEKAGHELARGKFAIESLVLKPFQAFRALPQTSD